MHYFKYDLDDLNQVFIPWREPEFYKFLSQREIRQTRLRHADIFYRYAWVDFWNGAESDSLGMEDFMGASNEEMPWDIKVDFEGFEDEIGLKAFKDDVENYVSRLGYNFIKMLESNFEKASSNAGSNKLFKDYLSALFHSYKDLKELYQSGLNPIQEIIAQAHLTSYQNTYAYLYDNYLDVWKNLLPKFDIRNKTIEQGELVDNIERYIKPDKLLLFYEFEVKLIKIGYLNHSRNKWIAKEKKSLTTFFLYCKNRGLIRKYFSEAKNNKLLKELQKRYNLRLGTMDKYSKWKGYNLKAVADEYRLLDAIK
ncbi:MAG: hypothetical protein R3250_03045 [Melioribacteraceae bacterium]|nr:hypothetical protein [Melioribacteraceae bacterium]